MNSFTTQEGGFSYVFDFTPNTGSSVWSLSFTNDSSQQSLFDSPTLIENISGESGISYSSAFSSPCLALGNPLTQTAKVYQNDSLNDITGSDQFYLINDLTGVGLSGRSGFGSTMAGGYGILAVGAPASQVEALEGAGGVFLFSEVVTGGLGATGTSSWGQLGIIAGSEKSGNYGSALGLVQNGTEPLIAGGATGEGGGSGVLYIHNSASSALVKKIIPTGENVRNFGKSVAFTEVNSIKYVIVGYDYGGTGKIEVYKESSQGLNDYTTSQSLGPAVGESGDRYGYVIDSNGGDFIVGSPEYGGSGRAFYYSFNEEAGLFNESQQIYPPDLGPDQQFGKSVAFDGVNGIITSNKDSGKGYVYYLNGNSWTPIASVSGNLNKVSGSFGGDTSGSHSVILEGDTLMVGTAAEEYSYYFTTGTDAESTYTGLSFSGSGGKLFDGDGNFLYGYNTNGQTSLSGSIFTGGYYTMFINSTVCNSKVGRYAGMGLTGSLNGWVMSGASQLSYYTLNLFDEDSSSLITASPQGFDFVGLLAECVSTTSEKLLFTIAGDLSGSYTLTALWGETNEGTDAASWDDSSAYPGASWSNPFGNNFEYTVSALSTTTTYFWRAKLEIGGSTYWSPVMEFTTGPC